MASVATLTTVPVVQHESGNVRQDGRGKANSINNRTFAWWKCGQRDVLVEVVRRGEKNTRIRRSLKTNGSHFLTETVRLSNFHHRKVVDGHVVETPIA